MNLAKHRVAAVELRALREEWDIKSREPIDWEELGLPIAGRLIELARHVADAVEGGEAEASLLRRALRYQGETEERSPFREWIDEGGRCLFMADAACRRATKGQLEIDDEFGLGGNIVEEPAIRRLCRWLLEEPGRRRRLFDHVWCKDGLLGDYYGCTEPVRMHLPVLIRHLEGVRAHLPAPAVEVSEEVPLETVRGRVTAGDFAVIGRIVRQLQSHLRAFDGGHLRGSYLIRLFQSASKSSDRRLFTDENIRRFEVEDMADLIGVVGRAADRLADGRPDQAVETPTDVEPSRRRRRRGRPRDRSLDRRDQLIRDEHASDNSKSHREIAEVLAERHEEDSEMGPFTREIVRNVLDGGRCGRGAGK